MTAMIDGEKCTWRDYRVAAHSTRRFYSSSMSNHVFSNGPHTVEYCINNGPLYTYTFTITDDPRPEWPAAFDVWIEMWQYNSEGPMTPSQNHVSYDGLADGEYFTPRFTVYNDSDEEKYIDCDVVVDGTECYEWTLRRVDPHSFTRMYLSSSVVPTSAGVHMVDLYVNGYLIVWFSWVVR